MTPLHPSGRQGCGLGITLALVCPAYSNSHLQTTSVCFCKLQKRSPRSEVPTQTIGLKRRAEARGAEWDGDEFVIVLVPHTMLQLQDQATGLIPRTHDDWKLF